MPGSPVASALFARPVKPPAARSSQPPPPTHLPCPLRSPLIVVSSGARQPAAAASSRSRIEIAIGASLLMRVMMAMMARRASMAANGSPAGLHWKLAPALAAGCTFVVKPAEQAPVSTLEFARLVEDGRLPARRVQRRHRSRRGGGRPARRAPRRGQGRVHRLDRHRGPRGMKGAAGHLARVSLELGGKSPNIVFGDADLDAAANGVIAGHLRRDGPDLHGRLAAAGSGATSTTRWSIGSRPRGHQIKLGDPQDPGTEMGPVAFARPSGQGASASRRRRQAPRARGWLPAAPRPLTPGLAERVFRRADPVQPT